MWVVSQTYMTALAKQHSMITESSTEDSNHLFFGIFTGFNAMRKCIILRSDFKDATIHVVFRIITENLMDKICQIVSPKMKR